MTVVNLVNIEEDVMDIVEDQSGGLCWLNLTKYIAARILENRIDQELNSVPVSILELELAGLAKK